MPVSMSETTLRQRRIKPDTIVAQAEDVGTRHDRDVFCGWDIAALSRSQLGAEAVLMVDGTVAFVEEDVSSGDATSESSDDDSAESGSVLVLAGVLENAGMIDKVIDGQVCSSSYMHLKQNVVRLKVGVTLIAGQVSVPIENTGDCPKTHRHFKNGEFLIAYANDERSKFSGLQIAEGLFNRGTLLSPASIGKNLEKNSETLVEDVLAAADEISTELTYA